MMRIDLLEDATPHVDPNQVAVPEDFPDWDDAKLEEIANTPIRGFEDPNSSGDDVDSAAPKYTPGVDLPKREPKAEEKILQVLKDNSDPMHLDALDGADLDPSDYEIQYVAKATVMQQTGMKSENTLTNTLGRLVRAGRIHRKADAAGYYAMGPDPTDTQEQQ